MLWMPVLPYSDHVDHEKSEIPPQMRLPLVPTSVCWLLAGSSVSLMWNALAALGGMVGASVGELVGALVGAAVGVAVTGAPAFMNELRSKSDGSELVSPPAFIMAIISSGMDASGVEAAGPGAGAAEPAFIKAITSRPMLALPDAPVKIVKQ